MASLFEHQLILEENGSYLRKTYTVQYYSRHQRGSWKGNCRSAKSIWQSKTTKLPCQKIFHNKKVIPWYGWSNPYLMLIIPRIVKSIMNGYSASVLFFHRWLFLQNETYPFQDPLRMSNPSKSFSNLPICVLCSHTPIYIYVRVGRAKGNIVKFKRFNVTDLNGRMEKQIWNTYQFVYCWNNCIMLRDRPDLQTKL